MRLSTLLISSILISASLGGFSPAHAGGFGCFAELKRAFSGTFFRSSEIQRELKKQESKYLGLLNSFAAKKSMKGPPTSQEVAQIRESLKQTSDEVLRWQNQRYEAGKVFRTIPMQPEYIGESMGMDSFRMDKNLKPYDIKYIRDAIERDNYQLRMTGKGHFTDIDGEPLNGIYDAVMDQDGKLYGYLRDGEAGAYYNHSSFFSGLPVAAAVELKFVNGKLVEVSGQSGHYKPSEEINQQLYELLRRKGLDTSKIKYSHLTRLAN